MANQKSEHKTLSSSDQRELLKTELYMKDI